MLPLLIVNIEKLTVWDGHHDFKSSGGQLYHPDKIFLINSYSVLTTSTKLTKVKVGAYTEAERGIGARLHDIGP